MSEFPKIHTAEWYREQGKLLFFHNGGDEEIRSQGLQYLIKASDMDDTEASYIVATLVLKKILKPGVGDPEEFALMLLCRLADRGDVSSRKLLNSICETKYESAGFRRADNTGSGELTDFEGKPIRINCSGLLTPIDAELLFADGKNILRLSANISFLYSEELPNRQLFEKAVFDGIAEWQGEYTVFGGQALTVELELTDEQRVFDNIMVIPLTKGVRDNIRAIGNEAQKKRTKDVLENKRSFAFAGLKWSVRSRKIIYVQSKDDVFSDYDEIKAVAKHEFGHALGLGDLYCSPVDDLGGVEKGKYRELDSYYVSDKIYNLVMCDHHGPVSNNDIEMLLLAFRDNEAQLYQPSSFKGRISEALGRGN